MNNVELNLLALIRESPDIAGRDLARAYSTQVGKYISYATLYVKLKRMEEAGLIRHRDTTDEDGVVRHFSALD